MSRLVYLDTSVSRCSLVRRPLIIFSLRTNKRYKDIYILVFRRSDDGFGYWLNKFTNETFISSTLNRSQGQQCFPCCAITRRTYKEKISKVLGRKLAGGVTLSLL